MLACEKPLHLGISWKFDAREETRKRGVGERKGSLQRSFINFHLHPEKPRDTAKRENCYANMSRIKTTFFTTDWFFFFIHWKTNVNMSDRIRAQYFDSRFVYYIWKVVYIQKTSKLPVAITNWRTAFSWTWFSFVLLQLLPTPFIVLLDGQLLILRQLRCNVHVTEFFYPVEFNRSKWRWKAALESGAWLSLHFHSSHFQS